MVLKMTMSIEHTHKPLINFLRGWPNPALLPSALIHEAADAVLKNREIAVPAMLYGPDWGDERLREELAKWLTDFNSQFIQGPVTANRLAITGGASQNLACILQTFTDPEYTRNIWIVTPSYFLAFRIFNDSGFAEKLRSVPEDDEGLNIDYLRREILISEKEAEKKGNAVPTFKPPTPWGKVYKHIIYAVPTFSNPSSKTMSLNRRKELVRLAREFDALIVADDVYDQLQWPSGTTQNVKLPLAKSIVPRIVDVDRYLDGGAERTGADGFGNTASNGSFSKIAGPGLRTGWCEGTPKLAYGVSQTGTSRSGGSPSQIAGTFLAEALATGGLQKHVFEVLQPVYARRWKAMKNAIQEHLIPLGVKLPQEDREVVGGYFVWLHLPPRIKAALLSRRCKETENLVVAEGSMFEVPKDAKVDAWVEDADGNRKAAPTAFPYDIRLCFAWEEEEKIVEGVIRLARVMKEMLEEPEGLNPHANRRSLGNQEDDQSQFW